MTEAQKTAHLLRRAGFGYSIRDSHALAFETASERIFSSNNTFEELYLQGEDRVTTGTLLKMSKEDRQELLNDLAANVKKLNLDWLKLMGKADGQLREKMSLFWHGHFAVRMRGFAQVESYINTIRRYALGNFGELLMVISKEPAMLRFLNNIQNKKNSPNENFAREVMELFTLGRGNYTENDIKEAARAFTGWGVNDSDEFELKPLQHDNGSKTIFGKTGNWNGDDVIRMILEREETAVFITRKIYRFFVNEHLDETRVTSLAHSFFQSNYNIPLLMKDIFLSDWFYDDIHLGSQIKSPVELIVELNRTFGISYDTAQPLLAVQRVLGQTLFFPPNVAGWAGGRNWIDNSTLITRMNLPKKLAEAGGLEMSYKSMDDENPNEFQKPSAKNTFNCSFNWELFEAKFSQVNDAGLWDALCEHLLAMKKTPLTPDVFNDASTALRSENIRRMALYIVRLPEYQLA
jgi:uncharacterized protein (DUF1800 family)